LGGEDAEEVDEIALAGFNRNPFSGCQASKDQRMLPALGVQIDGD